MYLFEQYKLCRVRRQEVGPKGVPYITTSDARTIRYPDPLVKVNDTCMVDIATGKIKDFIKFDSGNNYHGYLTTTQTAYLYTHITNER